MKNKILHAAAILLLMPTLAIAQMGFDSDEAWDIQGIVPFVEADGASTSSIHENSIAHPEEVTVVPIKKSKIKNPNMGISVAGAAIVSGGKQGGGKAPECVAGVVPGQEANAGIPWTRLETECFEGRPRSAESFYQVEKFETPREYIESDNKACTCMEQTSIGEMARTKPKPKKEEKEEEKKEEDELLMQHLMANVTEKQQSLQSMNEGSLVQTMLLVRNKTVAKELMTRYAAEADQKTKDLIAKSKKDFIHAAIKKLKDKSEANIQRIQQIAEKMQFPDVSKIKPPASEPAPGSCISMATYLAYQQIPKDQEFYDDLANMGDQWNEADWNIRNLKQAYNNAYRNAEVLSDEKDKQAAMAQVRSLRARMNFLKRNPLISSLFSMRPQKSKYKNKTAQYVRNELLKMMKKGLKPGCSLKDYQDYQKRLSGLFGNVHVNALIRTELNDTTFDEYQDEDTLLSTKLPTSQQALENKFSLMNQSKLSVKNCTMPHPDFDLDQCAPAYMEYCKLVTKVAEGIPKNSANLNSPSENMELETQYDFNPDPEKNEGFKKFSDEICNKPRISKGDSNVKMNFEEYKQTNCGPDKASDPLCAPANHEALLRKFLGEFSPQPAEGGDTELITRNEMTFAGVLADPPKVEITSADMAEVKKRSVSFSDLSTKGYPASSLSATELAQLSALAKAGKVEDKLPPTKAPLSGPVKEETTGVPGVVGPTFSSATSAAPVKSDKDKEDKRTPEEVDEERAALRSKISKTESDIEKARKGDDKSALAEMEKRLKGFEELLAKKDLEYKRLLEEREKEKAVSKSKSKKKGSPDPVDEDEDSTGIGSKSAKASDDGDSDSASAGGRSPASVPDGKFASGGGSFAGGTVSGSTGSFGSAAVGAGGAGAGAGKIKGGTNLLNAALLEKYGIVVDGPTEGAILLAPEKSDKDLKKVAGAQDGQNVPVVVSKIQYEKFKINDLDTLKDIYEKKLKDVSGSVVKLSVTAGAGEEPLVFFAIREGDKVVFQPQRKYKLSNMHDAFGIKKK